MSDTQVTSMPKRSTSGPLSQVKNLQDAFDHPQFIARPKQAVPKHMSPDRMLAVFVQSVQKTPKLREVNMMSLLGAFLSIASVGLEPNTALGHAYLIPFEKRKKEGNKWVTDRVDAQIIFGFQGLMELAYRSGLVRSLHADVVWPDEAGSPDHWECWYGSGGKLIHRPRLGVAREEGAMPALAYMHANLKGEGESFEVMSMQDVARVRNATQAYQTAMRLKEQAERENWKTLPAGYTEAPWIRHPIPMIRKTVFRAGQKWLPKSIELAAALQLDELQDKRSANFGAVIEGSADVLTTGLDAITDESGDGVDIGLGGNWMGGQQEQRETVSAGAPPLDPGRYATKADRPVQTSTAQRQPDAFDKAFQGMGAAPGRQSAPPAFEHYLIDDTGEVDGEAIRNPVLWAEGYVSLHEIARDRTTLLENNAEGLEAARGYPEAAAVLELLDRPGPMDGGEAAGAGPAAAMPLNKTGRGADIAGWVKGAVAAIGTLEADLLLAWLANNEPTFRSFPAPRRLEVQKALATRAAALGIELPRAAGTAPAAPAQPEEQAASGGQPAGQETAPAEQGGQPGQPTAEQDDDEWSYGVVAVVAKVTSNEALQEAIAQIRDRAGQVRSRNFAAYQRVDSAIGAKQAALRDNGN